MTPTYIVTADANDLAGWTAETLTEALRAPLAEIGVNVECKPRQFGGAGLSGHDYNDTLEFEADRIVARVVTG